MSGGQQKYWSAALAEDLLTRHLQVSFPKREPIPDWVRHRRWLPPEIAHRTNKRLRTVAVVGAGASYPVLDLSGQLASELEHHYVGVGREDEHQAELERLERVYGLARDQFETRLVALCRNPDDQRRVRDKLAERYGMRHPTLLVYEVLAHLLKHRYLDAIISFNFDELLDQSLDDELGKDEYARIVSERDCGGLQLDPDQPDYRPLYIKMHGTASEPESLRFTRESYYWTPKPIVNAVEELLDTDNLTLMNLGCRLAGFDFHHLLRMPRDMTIYHLNPQPLEKRMRKDIQRYRSARSGKPRLAVRHCTPKTQPGKKAKKSVRRKFEKKFLPEAMLEVTEELRKATKKVSSPPHWRAVGRHQVVATVPDRHLMRNPKHYAEYLRRRTVLELALASAKNRGVLSSSSLVSERCGRYYELYAQAARRAHRTPVSWPTMCAAGGLIEAKYAPDSYYARKVVCKKGTHPAPTKRDPWSEHRLPEIDPRRMAEFVLGEIDASRWPREGKLDPKSRRTLELLVKTITRLKDDHELEILSLDDRICSKVFVAPRVLATYTTFKTWTSKMVEKKDFNELRVVAETGGWLLDDRHVDRLKQLGERKLKVLVAFDVHAEGLDDKYGDTLDLQLIPWWRHNRHMRLACRNDVPIRAVYYARRQRTSMITPVALRQGADLKRLDLSFQNLWEEAQEYQQQLGDRT
jgi:hypothetical protein